MKSLSKNYVCEAIISVWKLCDNNTAYKHTGRPPPHWHGSQTRHHAAPRSQLHRQCAANLPHYRCLYLDGARRRYSAHCLRIRRGGEAPRKACSAAAPQIFQKWVP
jgi:hypothetical protein